MLSRLILFCSAALLLNGCCTKKACVGQSLPVISFNFFKPASLEGTRVVVRTMLNSQVIDSLVITSNFDATYSLMPFDSYNDELGRQKSFVIFRNGRSSVINNISIDFKKIEVKCNECFPFRIKKEKEWSHENFSYQHNGQTFSEGSLLTLD